MQTRPAHHDRLRGTSAWPLVSLFSALTAVAGCGSGDGGGADARLSVDAPGGGLDSAIDGPVDAGFDADPNAVPRPGFGTITGMCGVLGTTELTGAAPAWFAGRLDFADDRYDDPAERPLLTDGGEEVLLDGNAGGSSIYSEVFAFEWLARCELASLIKTETEVIYDTATDKTDILVEIDGLKIGVSVTRAVTFPFGTAYTPAAAEELLTSKLTGILSSSASVSAGDAWTKQILAVLAYDDQHALVLYDAWQGLDPAVRADSILVVAITDGNDLFIYSNQ